MFRGDLRYLINEIFNPKIVNLFQDKTKDRNHIINISSNCSWKKKISEKKKIIEYIKKPSLTLKQLKNENFRTNQ